jgi:hypothetical protein
VSTESEAPDLPTPAEQRQAAAAVWAAIKRTGNRAAEAVWAAIKRVAQRVPDTLLVLLTWSIGVVVSHAFVIGCLCLAQHETSAEHDWSWAAAMEHYIQNGEAAIMSVTLTATALVGLAWRRKGFGRFGKIFTLLVFVGVFAPAMFWPDVLLGKADLERATNTSVLLIVIGGGLAGITECILGLGGAKVGRDDSA